MARTAAKAKGAAATRARVAKAAPETTKAAPKVTKAALKVTKAAPKATKAAPKATKAAATPKAATKGQKRTAATIDSANSSETEAKLPRVDSVNTQLRKVIESNKTESNVKAKSKSFKMDDSLSGMVSSSYSVYQDYSCMLNQTNIGDNNNKYYVIQVAHDPQASSYYCFTRWGRVGEPGMTNLDSCADQDKAVAAFEKKFKDKTSNAWSGRTNFVPKPKKYTLLEIDEESSDEEDDDAAKPGTSSASKAGKCQLDDVTQRLARLIFSDDMFRQQMETMNLDIKKMPLGKLSKGQISKGLESLLKIEEALKSNDSHEVMQRLTSQFYTLIPHNFGRSVPPVIYNNDIIQQKKDVLITLADIELTQTLQKTKCTTPTEHPLDTKMNALGCCLERLDQKSQEFQWIQQYTKACGQNSRGNNLLEVFKVDRPTQEERFCRNADITHRKLLWHGTNVAVVAAILNSGLRIMPSSGGRVGKGIYFASEHAKSSGYVGYHYGDFEGEKNVGFMFLVEVALGKTHDITESDGCQVKAPSGYDSIVARGVTEPDSTADMNVEFGGRQVIVPKGKPKKVKQYSKSHFGQSEYLVYREDQARIRYLLKCSF